MPLDDDVRDHLQAQAAEDLPPVWEVAIEDKRRADRELAAQGARTQVAVVRDDTAPGPRGPVPVRRYHPGGEAHAPLLVYLHGGGFVFGDVDTHDEVARRFAAYAGAMVVSVDYRLAPENPFPAAVDDAEAALRWAWQRAEAWGADPRRVVVAGDSAGGTLAAVIARRLRDAGGPPLAGQLLVYPATDLTDAEHPSRLQCAQGYGLTSAAMRWFGQQYVGDPAAEVARHPDASPLHVPDASDLPPALVLTCEFDPLRDEGETYAGRLDAAGVPVQCVRLPGTIHGIFSNGARLRSAEVAWQRAMGWLQRTVGAARASR